MLDVAHFDQPDHEAYGRVTNPERYQAVVDTARGMIADLVKTFQVELTPGDRSLDFPDWNASVEEVNRLRPSQGAPLTFMFTEFPGVVVRVGGWCVEAFPACGCDACNEPPGEVVERLSELVGAAVEGSYEEELTKRTLTYTYGGRWGSSSSEKRLDRGEWKRHGVPAAHRWPAWPKR
ncbi:MAG: DUF6226 family protein [Acidimicrobiia bacterium]